MKKLPPLLLLLISLLLQSCIRVNNDDDIVLTNPSNYQPVITDRESFEESLSLESEPRVIENAGKIYTKDGFIFINEVNQGFHIINNSDPSNPENIGFINILGSSDLSIKGNVFYANNAIDLIAFTINETNQEISLTKRIKNTFPQLLSPEGFEYFDLEPDDIIIDWQPIN